MLPTSRIALIGESPHAHEQEAIDFVVRELPGTDPYHVWALFELVEPTTGRMYEVDLLVLGYSAIYLVEIKSGPGVYTGDAVDWYRAPPGASARWMDPPLRLANLKAKVLKSRLRAKLRNPDRAPRIEPLVFLSHADTDVRLAPEGKIGVVTRRDVIRALTRHEFPGSPPGWRADRIDAPLMKELVQAFESLGLRKRKGKLFAGSYELGVLVDDGTLPLEDGSGTPVAPSGYQDRLATHRDTPTITRRARVYLVPQQTTVERRQLLRRAADREVALLHSVREHPGVLRLADYVTDAPLGPTLLFDAFEGGVPLDAFLRNNPDLSFDDQLTLVEHIARALAHCHKREVRHGALGPHAVLVRRHPDTRALETRLFNFQLGAGTQVRGTIHASSLSTEPWALYQAPELREEAGAPTTASDIFSLGALAYLIFTKQPPATSVPMLDARLQEHGFLDPRVVTDEVPEAVFTALELSTHRIQSNRYDDVTDWVELLIESVTRPDAPATTPEQDPLEARKDDVLGGDLTVRGVLGYGATSRVLEVERGSDGRTYALKVSISPEHDERLEEEAKVLDVLEHPRIVRVVERRRLGHRTCLLLTLAGERTLQRQLSNEGPVSLDYASRYGEDLLSALEELESKNVVHRDIKPANVGVGAIGKSAHRLTLFDFSLGLVSRSELGVGTAVYRDPFLPQRGAWDAAADRWSATITLHELLTGVRPTVTQSPMPSKPGSVETTLTIAAERFDPAVREPLAQFFERALTPDAERRFSTAREMLRAWQRSFEPSVHTPRAPAPSGEPERDTPPKQAGTSPEPHVDHPTAAWNPDDLTPEQLAAIRPETPVELLPLSARAKNALDRAGLVSAGGLLSLPDNRLSSIRGVGRLVAREILGLRDRWRAVWSEPAAPPAPFYPDFVGEDLLLSATDIAPALVAALGDAGLLTLGAVASAPATQIEAILRRQHVAPSVVRALLSAESKGARTRQRPGTIEAWVEALLPESKKRTVYLASLYGLTEPFVGRVDVTVREVAAHHDVTTAAVYLAVSRLRETWLKHGALPELRQLVHVVLDDLDGAGPLDQAADALAARLPHDRAAPDAVRRARAAALFRVVSEVERDATDGLRVVRLGERGPWALADESLGAAIQALGRAADELADRPVLASPGEVARRLGEVAAGTRLATMPAERLLDVATRASERAARSTRLEIYPRGLVPTRALELSAPLLLAAGLTPEEVQKRVASRYPASAPLPLRPQLDALVAAHGLIWNGLAGQYQRKGQPALTTHSPTVSPMSRYPTAPQGAARSMDPESIDARDFDDKIANAIERKLLRVVGVRADRAADAAIALAQRAGVQPTSFDAQLIAAMKRFMRDNDIDASIVHQTDADGPVGADWSRLVLVAEKAAELVAKQLLPPERPLILCQPGLIARYRLGAFVQALVRASKDPRAAAIFLLVPAHDGGGLPSINGTFPIQGVLPSDGLWVSMPWLVNMHNAAA